MKENSFIERERFIYRTRKVHLSRWRVRILPAFLERERIFGCMSSSIQSGWHRFRVGQRMRLKLETSAMYSHVIPRIGPGFVFHGQRNGSVHVLASHPDRGKTKYHSNLWTSESGEFRLSIMAIITDLGLISRFGMRYQLIAEVAFVELTEPWSGSERYFCVAPGTAPLITLFQNQDLGRSARSVDVTTKS